MKKIVLAFVVLLTGISNIQAQQEAMYSHYSLNSLAFNAAYTGVRGALSGVLLHRTQWLGFEGAPETQYLAVHSPLLNENFALGVDVVNDRIGAINTLSPSFNAAYALVTSEETHLRFGLKGSFHNRRGRLSELALTDEAPDEAFVDRVGQESYFNVGAGLMFVAPTWYVGVSSPYILKQSYKSLSDNSTAAGTETHYYAHGGKLFEVHPDWGISATALTKVVQGAPFEVDVTAMAIYEEKFEAGLMFRSGDAFGALLGYTIQEHVRIGYAFDFSYRNQTFKYNNGSHEIMLRVDFIRTQAPAIVSPRFF